MTKETQLSQQFVELVQARRERLRFLFALTGFPALATGAGLTSGCLIENTARGIFSDLEWFVAREVRSGAGNRDSLPRDFYSSGATSASPGPVFPDAMLKGSHPSGTGAASSSHPFGGVAASSSHQVLRSKRKLACMLGWRGAAWFGIFSAVAWVIGLAAFAGHHLGGGVVLQGVIGGLFTGMLGGAFFGCRRRDPRPKAIFLGMGSCGLLGAFVGALLGVLTSFFGVGWAFPVVGAVLGFVVGVGSGLAKGA